MDWNCRVEISFSGVSNFEKTRILDWMIFSLKQSKGLNKINMLPALRLDSVESQSVIINILFLYVTRLEIQLNNLEYIIK